MLTCKRPRPIEDHPNCPFYLETIRIPILFIDRSRMSGHLATGPFPLPLPPFLSLSFFLFDFETPVEPCDISNCFRYTYDQKILFEDLIVTVTKKSFRFERMSGGGKVEKWKVLARRRLTIEATVRRVTIMRVFNARSLDSNYSHEVDKPSLRMVGLIKRATHAGST